MHPILRRGIAVERNERETLCVEGRQTSIDAPSAHNVASAQMRALVSQMKKWIPARPTVGPPVDPKADAEYAAIEMRRLVDRENLDPSDRVIARAIPRRGDAEHDRYFNPLAPVGF